MSSSLWIGPLVSGVAFGLLFGLMYPRLLKWVAKAPASGLPHGAQLSTRASVLMGLLAGAGFGALQYIEKLVEVGSAGNGLAWFLSGAKWFGIVAILGGIVVIGRRLMVRT